MENTVTLSQAADLVGVKKEALRARGRRGSLEILSAGQGAPARIDREELVRAYPEQAEAIRAFQPEVLEDAAERLRAGVMSQTEAAVETAQGSLAVLTQRHKEQMAEIRRDLEAAHNRIEAAEARAEDARSHERRTGKLLAAATLLLGVSGMYGWTKGQAVEAAELGAQEALEARQAVSVDLEGVRHELAVVVDQRGQEALEHEAELEALRAQLDAQETRKDEVADFIARRMADLEAMAAEVQR